METRKLFAPINIGKLKLKNRIILPAMVVNYGDESGLVTPQILDYFAARVKDIGMAIVESTSVAPGGRNMKYMLRIDNDDTLPGMKRLAATLKKSGAKAAMQLVHGGRKARPPFNNGIKSVAPSPIAAYHYEQPKELSLKEINEMIEAFAEAARRARDAGFDAVELHAAHGYLIHNFLSPLTNKRTDLYGGDFDSRLRFLREILERIRLKLGKNYPIIVRINGEDYTKGGITLKDAMRMAKRLEAFGADAISVLAGFAGSSEEGFFAQGASSGAASMVLPRGCFVPLAEAIKKEVNIPVIVTGRINESQLAESILEQGKADLVAIGRAFIADPDFATKAANNQYEDIRKCIACRTCIAEIYHNKRMPCAVNAEVGKEKEYRIKLARKKKKVLIIGAGPGGMEAARVAALRGHDVSLYDSKFRLGGNLVAASAVSFKKEMKEFLNYLSSQMGKCGVFLHLATTVDEKLIKQVKPDVVIAATGARSVLPAIPGIKKQTVTNAVDLLEGNVEMGADPIVVGGGMVGCEAAVFLAENGRKVKLVSRRNTDFSDSNGLAPDMEAFTRKWLLFDLWPQLDIEVIGNCTFKAVTDKGLIVIDRESKDRLIEGDSIVFALGLAPNNNLAKKIADLCPEFYEIGDCVQPRQIVDAVAEGAAIARKI